MIREDPDAIFWYRAFLEHQAEEESSKQNIDLFHAEAIRSLMWIGNMNAHYGTLVSGFLSKKKDNIGELYMPKEWLREIRKTQTEDQRKKIDHEVADSLRGL